MSIVSSCLVPVLSSEAEQKAISTGRPVSNENPFGVLSFDQGCCGLNALIAVSMKKKKTRKLRWLSRSSSPAELLLV